MQACSKLQYSENHYTKLHICDITVYGGASKSCSPLPVVNTDGIAAATSSGGISRAQGLVGQAALVAGNGFCELFRGTAEALVCQGTEGRGLPQRSHLIQSGTERLVIPMGRGVLVCRGIETS